MRCRCSVVGCPLATPAKSNRHSHRARLLPWRSPRFPPSRLMQHLPDSSEGARPLVRLGRCHTSLNSSGHSTAMGRTRCRATSSRQADRLFGTLFCQSHALLNAVPQPATAMASSKLAVPIVGNLRAYSVGIDVVGVKKEVVGMLRRTKALLQLWSNVRYVSPRLPQPSMTKR